MEKIAALRTFPQPRTRRQLRQFLGMMGYYSRFIPHYATRAALLTDLLQGPLCASLVWDPPAAQAFSDLRTALLQQPMLWMQRLKDSNDKVFWWYLALLPFSFTTRHCRGAQHVNADYLSLMSDVTDPQARASRGGPCWVLPPQPNLPDPLGRRAQGGCRRLSLRAGWGQEDSRVLRRHGRVPPQLAQ